MNEPTSPPLPALALSPRVSAPPHPRLRPALGRGYAGFAETDGPHVVLPATAAVGLIVKIRDSAHRPPAFIMGVHGEHTVLEGACAPAYLQVFLGPLGAYTLLGMPMTELRGQVVDLAEVLGPPGRHLVERLRAEPTWRGRFGIVDQLLLDRLDTGPHPSPEVGRAWQLLVAAGGSAPIRRIADEVGWSHKHLITRLGQQVGLAPKTAARLIRFDRVVRAMSRPRPHGWERIAAECGYADQSHLVREFRTFTGSTPTAVLAHAHTAGAVRSRRGPAPGRTVPGTDRQVPQGVRPCDASSAPRSSASTA
jgi:AraC-like DNA-binding protein